jgi:hypothetical protein
MQAGDLITENDLGASTVITNTLPASVKSQTSTTIILNTPISFDIPAGTNLDFIRPLFFNAIASDGVDAYAQAFAKDVRRVQITVWGIDTVEPWEPFTLDSSFPSIVQGTYRPSSLDYDLENDKVTIKGYKIA